MTPMQAIRAKCIDCVCGQIAEIPRCPAKDCPLYEYRSGHNPKYARRANSGSFKKNGGTACDLTNDA